MTNEQTQVRDWMKAFGQEAPDKPMIPSLEIRKLRAKLILEEALETIEKGLGMKVYWKDNWHEGKLEPAYEFRGYGNPNLTEIADGCEDLKVVTEGTLVACGLVKLDPIDGITTYGDPLFNEVIRSNWSKFWKRSEVDAYVVTDGDSPAFDPTAIVATDTLADEMNTYKAVSIDKYLVKDSNGKIIKSPSYSPANLVPIIEEMAKI